MKIIRNSDKNIFQDTLFYIKDKATKTWNWVKSKSSTLKKWIVGIIIGSIVAFAATNPPTVMTDISKDKLLEKYNASETIKAKYAISGASLKKEGKDKNKTSVELGNETANEFSPELKVKRWDGEAYLKITPDLSAIDAKDKTLELAGDKVKFGTPKVDYEMYEIPSSELTPEGAYEYNIILKEKPASNVIILDIETKGLDFSYQGELTTKETERGDTRPENVVGSYSIYLEGGKAGDYSELGGMNYRSGKFGHIYRPKIEDATGKWVWGELSIDEANGKLSVAIPQTFLDTAVYPVKHAAGLTLGYTTEGGSGISISVPTIVCERATSTSSGYGDRISVSVNSYTIGTLIKGALYFGPAGSYALVSPQTEEIVITKTSWNELNFNVTKPSISAVSYLVCYWFGLKTSMKINADSVGSGAYQAATYSDTWSDPISPTLYAYNFSIYLTYTQEILEEEGFRFRYDDGSEVSANWIDDQDTNIYSQTATNTRLRFLVNASSTATTTEDFQIEYKSQNDSYYKKMLISQPSPRVYNLFTPLDNASNIGPTVTVATNQFNIKSGDVVFAAVYYKPVYGDENDDTIYASTTSGQNWTNLGYLNYDNYSNLSLFYCTFDGTWDANQTFYMGRPTSTNPMSAIMLVYRNISTENMRASMVGYLATNPITITGTTTINANSLVVALWAAENDGTWSNLTADWSLLDKAQYRNLGGDDLSMAMAYKIIESPGATGNISYTNSVTVGGIKTLIVFEWASNTEPVLVASSSNIPNNGTSTTVQLSAPSGKTTSSFMAGILQDDGNPASSTSISANKYSEFEWCFQFNSLAIENDIYDFRITKKGAVLSTYSVSPQITIGTAPPPAPAPSTGRNRIIHYE